MIKHSKISCLVLDDQLFATNIINTYVQKMPQLELLLSTTDVALALSTVENTKVDLIFLDIQMPKMNGLEFIRRCKDRSHFVLTTAYSDYAINGYEYDVIDFLLKPIPFERFQRAIQKYEAMAEIDSRIKSKTRKNIVVKGDAKQKYHQLAVEDILFIKGMNNYITIHTVSGTTIITYMNLKDIVVQLSTEGFCQVHRSYIVSLIHIKSVSKCSICIGTNTIPIGASYRTKFFERWDLSVSGLTLWKPDIF